MELQKTGGNVEEMNVMSNIFLPEYGVPSGEYISTSQQFVSSPGLYRIRSCTYGYDEMDQSEASIQVMWSVSTNQRPVLRSIVKPESKAPTENQKSP